MSAEKMCFFPSLYDTYTTSSDIWTALLVSNGGLDQPVGVEEPWPETDRLSLADYQPLEFYSPPVGTSIPWSAEDDICELDIRLKEIELLKLVGEGFDARGYRFLSSVLYDEVQQSWSKK